MNRLVGICAASQARSACKVSLACWPPNPMKWREAVGQRFSGLCATVVESLAALLEVRMRPAGNLSVCGLQVLLSCMQALMEQFKFGQRADVGR